MIERGSPSTAERDPHANRRGVPGRIAETARRPWHTATASPWVVGTTAPSAGTIRGGKMMPSYADLLADHVESLKSWQPTDREAIIQLHLLAQNPWIDGQGAGRTPVDGQWLPARVWLRESWRGFFCAC